VDTDLVAQIGSNFLIAYMNWFWNIMIKEEPKTCLILKFPP